MLRKLQIHGASWNAVSAINTQQVIVLFKLQYQTSLQAPTLRSLDLSWSSLTDASIEEMTSSPTGHIRPGIKILHSRLCKLQELVISGADITDVSLRHLSKLPELQKLILHGEFDQREPLENW